MTTIEKILRAKIETGFDPVTVKVSARGVNEENLEVLIEGVHYSVSGNNISLITEGEDALPEEGNTNSPQSYAADADTAAPAAIGSAAGDADTGIDTGEGSAGDGQAGDHTHSEQPTAPVNPDDLDGNGINDRLEERTANVLRYYNGTIIEPVDTAGNGATIYRIIGHGTESHNEGELIEVARGTLRELELGLEGASQSAE